MRRERDSRASIIDSADDLPRKTIFRGIGPFLVADFVRVGLLIAFPIIALALV